MLMKRTVLRRLLWAFLLIAVIAYLSGCVTTRPNTPYEGPYPPIFNELSAKNPLLANELGKLPEIQDGISSEEARVLERILELYNEKPDKFNKAFEQMNKVGIPEVRKYCSPLQTLFWMIEDGQLDEAKDILKDYSLNKLLSTAWGFDKLKPLPFSDEQISFIIDNMNDKNTQKLYSENKYDKYFFQSVITLNYRDKYKPEVFNKKARKIIRKVESENEHIRWKDFKTVVERLNAPELIDYYERMKFRYVVWHKHPANSKNAYYVFKHNKAECVRFSIFTVYCLRKAGYKAWKSTRYGPEFWPWGSHTFCIFENNGVKYIMDNGRRQPDGIILFEESDYFSK